MTLAAGILGFAAYGQSQAKNDAQARSNELAKEISERQDELSHLNAQLTTAQKRLSDAGLPPVTDANSSAGAVLRQGSITLTQDYCGDLDSTVANWRVTANCDVSFDIQNSFADHGIVAPLQRQGDFAVLPSTAAATFATCQSVTNFSHIVDYRTNSRGTRFCLRTSDGNLAVAQIDAVDGEYPRWGTITLSVVVWKTK